MIIPTILATLATGEPIAPGQSPIPVVIIQQGHGEGMTTGEWWVTVSAFCLAAVTLATVVHLDVMLHHIRRMLAALIPVRRTLPGRVLSRSTDNSGNVEKAISPRQDA